MREINIALREGTGSGGGGRVETVAAVQRFA